MAPRKYTQEEKDAANAKRREAHKVGGTKYIKYKDLPDERKYQLAGYDMKKKYGVGMAYYEEKFAEQGGVCKLCSREAKDAYNPKNRLCIDHCHETGIIRGLLCTDCNRALGLMRDNKEILFNAIEYLNYSRSEQKVKDEINKYLSNLEGDELIDAINELREIIHEFSPFKDQPVDFVKWVKNDTVYANSYNPNSVAPPEMELLRVSIDSDGYTSGIVTMSDPDGRFEVIDGFHRHRVGRECADITARIHGYLPIVQIRESQTDKTDRMASTIRHNRARGKHKVEAMSDIVIELKKRNWSDEKICKNLGMDADEVLRLCQISGIAELFSDEDFSYSWDIDDMADEVDALEDVI